MQFLLLFVGLVLGIFGAVSKTVEDGDERWILRVTKCGWIVCSLLLFLFGLSVVNYRTNQAAEAERLADSERYLQEQRTFSFLTMLTDWEPKGKYRLRLYFPKEDPSDLEADSTNEIGIASFTPKSLGTTIYLPFLDELYSSVDLMFSSGESLDDIVSREQVEHYTLDHFEYYDIALPEFETIDEAIFQLQKYCGEDLLQLLYSRTPTSRELKMMENVLSDSSQVELSFQVIVGRVTETCPDPKKDGEDHSDIMHDVAGGYGSSGWILKVPLEMSTVRRDGNRIKVSFKVKSPLVQRDDLADTRT